MIRNESEYKDALKKARELIVKVDSVDHPDRKELMDLAEEIEVYEDKICPIEGYINQ
jgi:antitoxin component HigA of HigAB toxin-antitoxin module